MTIKFLTDIDLNKNYLRKARFENLETAPSSPENGQVYYNTVDKCYYFYQDIVPTPAEAPFGEWVKFVKTADLVAALALKQDLLTAGEGITIEQNQQGQTVISSQSGNTVFEKNFVPADFTNNTLTILATEHGCGTSPTLDTAIMISNNIRYEVEIGFSYDASGNVTIEAKNGFTGFVRLSSSYRDAVSTESSLSDILYGTV